MAHKQDLEAFEKCCSEKKMLDAALQEIGIQSKRTFRGFQVTVIIIAPPRVKSRDELAARLNEWKKICEAQSKTGEIEIGSTNGVGDIALSTITFYPK